MFESPERYSDYIKVLSRWFQNKEKRDFYKRELQFFLEESLIMQARVELLTEMISIAVDKDSEFMTSMTLMTEELLAEKANIIENISYVCPINEKTLKPFENFNDKNALAQMLANGFNELLSLNSSNEFMRAFTEYEAGFLYLYKNVDVLQDYFGDKINKYFFLVPENFKKYGEIRKKRYDIALAAIDGAFKENLHK